MIKIRNGLFEIHFSQLTISIVKLLTLMIGIFVTTWSQWYIITTWHEEHLPLWSVIPFIVFLLGSFAEIIVLTILVSSACICFKNHVRVVKL